MTRAVAKPPSLGKQQFKSQQARATICEATVHCLEKFGYHKTSINRVVAEVPLSKGAVQHHFPSKEDLMAATVDHVLERAFMRFESDQKDAGRQSGTLLDFIAYQWDKHINTAGYLAIFEIVVATRTDPALRARIAERLTGWSETIERRAMQLFESPAGNEAEVHTFVEMTRCFLRGLVVQEFAEPAHAGRSAELIRKWVSLFAAHLRPR